MTTETETLSHFSDSWTPSSFCSIVHDFVGRHPNMSKEEQIAMMCIDQERRWTARAPAIVEDYANEFPELTSDPEVKLRLIQSELDSSELAGTAIERDDLTIRFPELTLEIQRKLRRQQPLPQGSTPGVSPADVHHNMTFSYSAFSAASSERRYARLWRLGTGTFGEAWAAFDTLLRRRVAIKVSRSNVNLNPNCKSTFVAEARRLARLSHPGIVQIYDFGETSCGSVFIVSKLIDGETLQSRLAERAMSINESVRLIERITQSLHHSHSQGIIHRDIKPANIIIDRSTGEPVVLDFGLAIQTSESFTESAIAGTPAYMSPEQTPVYPQALRSIDARTDIFSVGVVLYEMLTGVRPFAGDSRSKLFEQIVNNAPCPPHVANPDVPESLSALCLRALEKTPDARFQSASEMLSAIHQWRGLSSGRDSNFLKNLGTKLASRLQSFPAFSAGRFRTLIASSLIAVLMFVLGTIIRLKLADGGEIIIECVDPAANVTIELVCEEQRKTFVLKRDGENKFSVDAGNWKISISGDGYAEYAISHGQIIVKKGETTVVTVTRNEKPAIHADTQAIEHLLNRGVTLIVQRKGVQEEIYISNVTDLPSTEFIVTGVWFPEFRSPDSEGFPRTDVEAIRCFKNLVLLDLSTTAISDHDLEWITAISSLAYLHLRDTNVTDAGAEKICRLKNLLVLSIDETAVTDAGLATLRKLPSLGSLLISGPAVTDKTLAMVRRNLTSLTTLSCTNANISDEGIRDLLVHRGFKNLTLSHNRISDHAVAFLAAYGGIDHLDLADTEVTDNCVGDLLKLTSLRYLNLSGTYVTSEGLRQLSSIEALLPKSIDVDSKVE